MNLTGIISISGKPGLFKVVAQGKNNVIVESLEERKRFPAYASDRISALDDISIYTYDEDKPLKEIYVSIFEKEKGGETISHKEDITILRDYLVGVLPNYDQERVYPSDIKKLFQWYNMLHKAGELKLEEKEEKAAETGTEDKPKTEKAAKGSTAAKTTEKKPADKKAPAAKTAKGSTAGKTPTAAKNAGPKAAAKSAGAKKVVAPKTGGGRGK